MADTDLDPLLASRALSSMISRLAFNHFVVDAEDGNSDADYEALLATATRLWSTRCGYRTRASDTPDERLSGNLLLVRNRLRRPVPVGNTYVARDGEESRIMSRQRYS